MRVAKQETNVCTYVLDAADDILICMHNMMVVLLVACVDFCVCFYTVRSGSASATTLQAPVVAAGADANSVAATGASVNPMAAAGADANPVVAAGADDSWLDMKPGDSDAIRNLKNNYRALRNNAIIIVSCFEGT